jgi:hypothetical protein
LRNTLSGRHCERSEAIQGHLHCRPWIASVASLLAMTVFVAGRDGSPAFAYFGLCQWRIKKLLARTIRIKTAAPNAESRISTRDNPKS